MSLYLLVVTAMLAAAPTPRKAAPEPSAAGPEALKAKAAFVSAQALYKQGRFLEAIKGFEEAYRLKPHPIVFYNIGRCYEQLDDAPRALRHYRLYLHQLPDAVDREAVAASIVTLEGKLKDRGIQQLMVFAEPADAQVTVDARPLGPPPASIELGSGDHRLLIERPGRSPVNRSFVMSTSKSMELSFTLTDEPQAGPPPTPPLTVAEPMPAPAAPSVAASPVSTTRFALRSKAWVPLIAVALGGATAAVGFSQMASASQALDLELTTQMMVTDTATGLAARGKAMQTVGWVGVGVAIAGLAATAVFWFLPASDAVAPVATLGPGGATLGLAGRF